MGQNATSSLLKIHNIFLFPGSFSGIIKKSTPLTQRVALSDFYQLTVSEADSLMEHLSEVCLQVLSDLMYLTEEIAIHDTPVLHKLALKTAKGTEIN